MWKRLLAISLTITYIIPFTEAASADDPHWVRFNPNTGKVPDDAIVGGHQGETLYISRAPHAGSLTPGKFIPSLRKVVIPWGGAVFKENANEILVGRNYQWVPTTIDKIPSEAVVGGHSEINNEALYICRAKHSGNLIVGKVHKYYGLCYLPDANEIGVTRFEVLVVSQSKIPQITGKPTVTSVKGKTVNIQCNIVAGKPTPKISWQFKAKADSRFVSVPGSDNILKISNVDAKNAGTYKCIATNNAGTGEHLTEVIIQIPPTITSSTTVYNVIEGKVSSVRIPCEATGFPQPAIAWRVNGKVISANTKFSIDNGTLVIKAPTVKDTQSYTCEARNDAGYNNVTVQLKVNPMTEKPQVTGKSTVTSVRGKAVNIQCNVVAGKPKPTISWQFRAKADSRFVSVPGSDNILKISNVNAKNAGTYKCIATNNAGTGEHLTEVIIQIPPAITSSTTVYNVIEGKVSSVRIPCEATGFPQPTIAWRVNGKVISANTKFSIDNGTLVIKAPSVKDTQSYTCEARNDAGYDNVTVQLKVNPLTEKPQVTGKSTVTSVRGKAVNIQCNVVAGKPKPTISWQFRAKADSRFVSVPGSDNILKISNVNAKNAGTYKCIATNNVGKGEHLTEVIIQIPPTITSSTTVYNVIEGKVSSVRIPCEATGFPQPAIAWRVNGKIISANTKFSINKGTLVIKSPTVKDTQSYTCEARNDAGYDNLTVQLKVSEKPRIPVSTTQRAVSDDVTSPTFDNTSPQVQTTKCLIPRKPNTGLIISLLSTLSSATTWPKLDSTTNYLQVQRGQTVIFSCDSSGGETSYFQKFPERNSVVGSCIERDSFMVEGKPYKISDLKCTKVETAVIKNKKKCLTETSELVRIGYKVHGFSEIYEVCFDTKDKIPLFSHVKMSKGNREDAEVTNKLPQYPVQFDAQKDTYMCNNATSTCCYDKVQLVNVRDVSGPAQRTTFMDALNAVPHWRPCDMTQSPWKEIEDTVRSQVNSYDQIDVWSGTHMLQKNNGIVTPRLLWKVLKFDDSKSIAVVYVNGPEPSEADILCKNTCGDEAGPWSYDRKKHIYCCDVDEFLHAFGLGGSTVGKLAQSTNSFDTIFRKKFSSSNFLLQRLLGPTSNLQMIQKLIVN